MVQHDEQPADDSALRPARRGWRVAAACLVAVLVLALAYVWVTRKSIADNYIAAQLEQMDLPATYEVAAIGPDEQVIRNLVVGPKERPDLTVAEVHVRTRLRFGFPGIGRITLVRPRLYGRVHGGKPSFGSLDKVLFTGSKAPFRLPDLDLGIQDGRALIRTDFGPVGIKVDGKGQLRGGFDGELAAIAPRLDVAGCAVEKASIYGRLTVASERPRFVGPLRLARASCPQRGGRLERTAMATDITFDRALDGGEGKLQLVTGAGALPQGAQGALNGEATFTYRAHALNTRFELEARRLAAAQARAERLAVSGRLRSAQDFANIQVEGDVKGSGLSGGPMLDRALARAQASAEGTLVAPLLARMRGAFARETRASTLEGAFLARRGSEGISVVVPRAALQGTSGQSLLAVSRVQVLARAQGLPRISGNFVTGGDGLPRIGGRMERANDGSLVLRAQMPEYRAGDASLAMPQMAVVQARSGAIGFTGSILASGALPGGSARNLLVPVDGRWNDDTIELWRSCAEVRFDELALASLSIDRRQLTLCPARGRPMLRLADGRLSIAGGLASLDLAGRLGATPIRLASGPVGFAYPGVITARGIDVLLGPAATASHFRIANLNARAGRDIAGTFDGSDVSLYAVPLDLHEVRGAWRYAGGVLSLGQGSFRLEDREQVDRFQPVIARDATLTLRNNVIDAVALMREPASDRAVVLATIRHDLSRGSGHADLAVQDITFDEKVQPETLTRLALGVVANTRGTVRGSGRIDWDAAGVTSTGSFTTDKLDFAAAFGPVQGVAGTIRFTDLLGLVTAPDQQLRVASINPGIEVNDGVITYALQPGLVIAVNGGTWPFVGGTLRLLPTRMAVGTDAVQNYTLEVTGADAALFVQRLELANLNATGTFDGTLPLIFDQNGGRIEGGLLKSRPPGGNVSYVGELTYKDLSTMANFAFDTLRSLDYRQMSIGMNGALEGEIVTRLSFSGVTQGQGASKNFLTRRIAKLPIQFNVNLRAPFFQLVTSFKSLYDPAFVRDPRTLGLIDANGRALPHPSLPLKSVDPTKHSVQPAASETMP
ncbi:YdbH domain-containing protein [Novosphingobium sp. 9U]|uniref:intermembrane phospholipid transport protein YdbH family protein n=1 Tax=Novosphingobium sp. 9U TaxID=2653158 RepID=UPI001F3DF846|nr:YdbH domain-containing protein [Novosphingobium sp. 9U]